MVRSRPTSTTSYCSCRSRSKRSTPREQRTWRTCPGFAVSLSVCCWISWGSGRHRMSEGRGPAALKRSVAERAGDCCEYCRSQARLATHPFSVEHILPRSRGGEATEGNLALACQGCNNHKYD